MKKIKTPDYYSTERYIRTLRNHVNNNSQPESFLPALKRVMKGLGFYGTTIENKFIHRARWNDSGRLFNHTDELKYPPKNCVKKKGRLNDIGENILYAALCELGTIIESKPAFDRLFTIAKIEKTSSATPLIFFPIAVEKPPFNFPPKNKREKIIFDYLYNEMTKSIKHEDEYNSTIAISHFFLGTQIKSGSVQKNVGLAYPSATGREVSNRVTYNLAMTSEVFDANYKIVEATVYFLSNEKTHYQLNPLNTANVQSDGQLVWKHSYEEMLKNL